MLEMVTSRQVCEMGSHTNLADEDCAAPAELLVQRVRQPCDVSAGSEDTRLHRILGALTTSDDGTEEVWSSVGQAEQPGVPYAVSADAELVLIKCLGAIHDSFVCSMLVSVFAFFFLLKPGDKQGSALLSGTGMSPRSRLTHSLDRGTQRTNYKGQSRTPNSQTIPGLETY